MYSASSLNRLLLWLIANQDIFNYIEIKEDATVLKFGVDVDTFFFIICASSGIFQPFTSVVIHIDMTGDHLLQ